MCLVGHVTKEGLLAGPKLVEHIVDTVLYFEGDTHHDHRIVRAAKNRFGTTLEIGLFRMTGSGLECIEDASTLLLEPHDGPGDKAAGSVVTAALQGTRVLMVEVQALTADAMLGTAKRKVSGADALAGGDDHCGPREARGLEAGGQGCVCERGGGDQAERSVGGCGDRAGDSVGTYE